MGMALRNQPSLKHPSETGTNRTAQSKYGRVDHTADVMAKRRQLLAHHRAKMDATRGEVSQARQDDIQPDASGDQGCVSTPRSTPSTT
jgi:hypothetical protein